MKDNVELGSAVSQRISHSFFLQEDSKDDEDHKVQGELEKQMKRLDFETQVFYDEQKLMIKETFEKNQVINQEIPAILDLLIESELTPEMMEAYERIEQLDYAFEEKALLTQQNPLGESLERFENNCNEAMQALDLEPFSSELIKQASATKHYESKTELMFMIIKTMSLFRFRVDDEDWLNVSIAKRGEMDRDISYRQIRNIEKVDLRIERMESIEVMLYGINFLLENCLEEVSSLCLSFTGRYISNKEAEKFSKCGVLKKSKLKLTLDFHEYTFENEETPLMFINGEVVKLEDLDGFSWFLGDTNATQKTVNDFCQLVGSKMKNLKHFVYDGSHLSFIPNLEMNKVLLDKASELLVLELGVQQTPFTDNELIVFSETVLPQLKKLEKFRLWLGFTQITDQGLLSLFQSIANSCASRLKAFLLGTAENRVTDESFTELVLNVLPLMENLEDLRLWIQRTLATDKSLIDLWKNMKFFASKLRKFGLNVCGTAASDAMIDALALKSLPLMKVFCNLFSPMVIFPVLEEFELNCSETAITDKSVTMFARRALSQLANLKKFNFYANNTKVRDSSLKPLFQNLSKCHQLHKMNIWLNETRIGEGSVLILAESIPFLVNLTHLSLSFSGTKLGDLGVGRLCRSLKPLAKNLGILRLDFNDTKATDEGIFVLGNEVAPEMRSLKEFKLFVARTQIGDASLKPLFENLKQTMVSLQDIQLHLSGTLITDQCLLALVEKSLTRVERLRTVKLWATNTKLSDLSLVPLIHSFKKKVGDVSKLHLMLQSTKITNETLKALSTEVFVNMRNLQDFQLNFEQSQFTDASMAMLVDSLANKAQRLGNLVLQFNSAIGDNSIRMFADKVIPNLTNAQDFKLTWTVSLSSSTLKALCVNANKAIKNIKTFQITSSQLSVACSNSTSHQKSLKELYFELNKARINDSDMKPMLESFEGQVSQVKAFSFKVENTNVYNTSIKTLAEKLFLFIYAQP